MDDLFRFVALRSPTPSDATRSIDLTNPQTLYKGALGKIHSVRGGAQGSTDPGTVKTGGALIQAGSSATPNPVQQALAITKTYLGGGHGGGFIADVSKLP